jgi:glucokinase
LVLGDRNGAVLERHKLRVAPSRGAVGIRDQIQTVLPELLSRWSVGKVGVGFGGPIDWRTGRVCRSHQIEGWSEFDLAGWLGDLVQAPVRVDNDANVGALGEARCGAGVGFNPAFYVTLGSGVGGGLAVDGNIYHGASPGEAEIGHVRLDRQGTTVEARCSGWAVDERIRALRVHEPGQMLSRLAAQDPGGEARHLSAALREGDSTARKILAETAEDLAFGLSHVMHLFHPAIIILGGGLASLGEPLRAAVESSLSSFIMEAFVPGTRVALAGLGEDAVPVGALHLAHGL